MTIWTPQLSADGPAYRVLADAIEIAVDAGELRPGDRLPTHRALAARLGVTVGTVTRGYAEARRRGLTVGEVGRGTFVREPEPVRFGGWAPDPEEDGDVVDLSISLPPTLPDGEEGRLLAETLRDIAVSPDPGRLLRYRPDTGDPRHREAASRWIERTGLSADPDHVVITAGAQHALGVLFSTLLRPGDTVLAAEVTYPGAKAAATLAGLHIQGVPVDGEGVVPEAVDRACRRDPPPGALYVVPTIQNPTGGVLSAPRREALAAVARDRNLLIVEDDVHALLPDDAPPPLASLVPERTFYVCSLTKSLAMGLRTGFVVAPGREVERLRAGVRSTLWMAAPLMAEVAARWMASEVAPAILRRKRAESAERQRIAAEVLAAHAYTAHPRSYYVWLTLPEPLRSDEVVAQASRRGVRLAGAEAFAVGRTVPAAVRVSLGIPDTRDELRRGLEIVADVLEGRPERCATVL